MNGITTMTLLLDELIAEHNAKTGAKMTRYKLARELYDAGLYRSHQSAINALNYVTSGKPKGLDFAIEIYLCDRFGKPRPEIYKSTL